MTAASVAADLAATAAELGRQAAAAHDPLPPEWHGQAADAARAARDAEAVRLATAGDALRRAAQACAEQAGRSADETGDKQARERCAAALHAASLLLSSLLPGGTGAATSGSLPGPGRSATDWSLPGTLAVAALRLGLGRAVATRRWWQSLPPVAQQQVGSALPAALGAADGVPARVRDQANRGRLAQDLAAGDPGAAATARALGLAGQRTDPATGEPLPALLLAYDPAAFDGDGAATVSYGDPDLADDVAVLVPGLGSDLAALPHVGADALALQQAASRPGSPAAVLAWLGYDAPSAPAPGGPGLDPRDLAGVLDEDAARRGSDHLQDLLDGLTLPGSGPADPPAHVSVVGHSYGSTTAALAFAGSDGHPPADDLVLLGSPGAGGLVGHAHDLHPGDGVHVAADDDDPVTWLGSSGRLGLGPDPAQTAFGAERLPTGPGDPLPGPGRPGLLEAAQRHHGAYLDPGSRSLEAVADVVRGDPAPTVPGRSRPARSLLVAWLTGRGTGPGH